MTMICSETFPVRREPSTDNLIFGTGKEYVPITRVPWIESALLHITGLGLGSLDLSQGSLLVEL